MYRDYKNFSNETFRIGLLSAMERYSNISLADFHSEFLYLLGKHAPVKKRKTTWTKNLNKQSWLGLSFEISF